MPWICSLFSNQTATCMMEFTFLFHSQVAYAKKDLRADVVLGIATGRYHASLLTNKEVWEPACAAAGRASGDLVVSS